MITHHPAIGNHDSAGFIVVWIAQIPLLRNPTAFFPKLPLLPGFNLIGPAIYIIMSFKGDEPISIDASKAFAGNWLVYLAGEYCRKDCRDEIED